MCLYLSRCWKPVYVTVCWIQCACTLCGCIPLLPLQDWLQRYWSGRLRNRPKTCLTSSCLPSRSISFTLCPPSFSSIYSVGRFPSPQFPTSLYKSLSHLSSRHHSLPSLFSQQSPSTPCSSVKTVLRFTSCSTFSCISHLCVVLIHPFLLLCIPLLLESINLSFLLMHPHPPSPSPLLQFSPPLFFVQRVFFNSLLLITTSSPPNLLFLFLTSKLIFPSPSLPPPPSLPGWLSDGWAGTAGVAGQAAHLHDSCAAV